MMLDLLWHASRPRAVLPPRLITPDAERSKRQPVIQPCFGREETLLGYSRLLKLLRQLDPRPRVPRHSITGKTSTTAQVR
ncbi:hypothetical protein VWZ88_07785 [Phaeobacter sp. JH20_36]|uniref:hypothetical protein n=1 Tax=Phaeobacter TaxID=302485 RepID=UPI0030C8EA63